MASREERMARLQRVEKLQAKQSAAPKQKAAEPWYEDFGEGLAVSGMDTYYGIKSLVTDLDPEDRATLADWKQDASESGWGTAGQVVGEIAQIAVPAGGLLKGAKMLGKGRQLLKAAPVATTVAADVGASAALGGLQLPEQGETRLGQATEGGAWALGGGAVGAMLGKTIKGIKKTPDAEKLLKKGVRLTPAMAGDGAIPNVLDTLMQVSPLAQGRKQAIARAERDYVDIIGKSVVPTGYKQGLKNATGQKLNTKIDAAFTRAYDDAWEKAGQPNGDVVYDVVREGWKQAKRLDDSSAKTINNAIDDLVRLTDEGFTPEKLKALDKGLRNEMGRAVKDENIALKESLEQIRTGLREAASPEGKAMLTKIDKKFPEYLTVTKAATGKEGLMDAGQYMPDALARASKMVGGERAVFKGTAPLLDMARMGGSTLGKPSPPFLANIRKAVVGQSPAPSAGMDFMGDLMLGQRGTQKEIHKALSPIADALRKRNIRSTTVGGGYGNE